MNIIVIEDIIILEKVGELKNCLWTLQIEPW